MNILRVLYLALFFSLPISIENFSTGAGIIFPSEPLQIIIALLLLFNWKEVLLSVNVLYRNPLFIFITVYVLWSWLSCFYSALPLVSIKYTFIETLHVFVFFIGFLLVYKKDPSLFIHCIIAYSIPFFLLLIRGWYLHAQYDFAIDFSAAALRPFYRDHPYYGVVISFLIPLWIYLYAEKRVEGKKMFLVIALAILLISLFLSFSRASWLTAFIGGVFTLIIFYARSNITKLITMSILTAVAFTVLVMFLFKVSQKKQFIKNTTITNQFMSTFNWSHDVANLERLNRYKCALRMFQEKPLTGFGNNMYKFTYQAYQKDEEKTRISVDEAMSVVRSGKGGNSHSDYLAALTELGIIGLIFWLGIVFSALFISTNLYIKNNLLLYLFIFYSLFTYFSHVWVNNFIHDDKISGLVWACCGVILVASKGELEVRKLFKSNTYYTE